MPSGGAREPRAGAAPGSSRLAHCLRRLYRRFAYRPERHYMRRRDAASAASGAGHAPR